MNTFTTRTEAINFLVAQGKPLAHAKVAVNESLNYDDDGDTRDLIAHDFHGNNPGLSPCTVTERDLLQTYEDMCGSDGYFTLEADGFHFEGEVKAKFDVNGDPLY